MNFLVILQRLVNKIDLEIDLLKWWFKLAPLRNIHAQQKEKTLLVCAMLSITATAKAEALFSAVLRKRGFKLVVLLPYSSPILERCFCSIGNVEFIYLNDFLNSEDIQNANFSSERYLGVIGNFVELFNLNIDGVRTGQNVLSKSLRTLRVGTIDFSNTTHLELIRKNLSESIQISIAIRKILSQVRPDLALFNERGYTPAGEIFDACLVNGIDVIQWLGSPLKNCLVYKRYNLENRDQHPLSISQKGWEFLLSHNSSKEMQNRIMVHLQENYHAEGWYNHQQLNVGKKIREKSDICLQLGLDPTKKTAVVFSHILYDATFFYGSSLFPDYLTWLLETVRLAISNSSINWIIKVHPVNVWRSRMDGAPMEQLEVKAINEAFGQLPPHIKFILADSDINTYSLFSFIDYGLTVRGTIGMELPCFGIPVITAGTGRYSGHGFTIEPTSIEEYGNILLNLQELAPLGSDEIRKAQLFAYGTLILRGIPMDALQFAYNEKIIFSKARKMNVNLSREKALNLENSADLGLFQDWVCNGDLDELFREFV